MSKRSATGKNPSLKSDVLGIRLEASERDALERAARRDDRPVSTMARKIILDWLREHDLLETTS